MTLVRLAANLNQKKFERASHMTATYLLISGNLLWEILSKYGHDPETFFIEEGVNKDMLYEELAAPS